MPGFKNTPAYRLATLSGNSCISYLDSGPTNAPVLLFLHGLGDNALIWSQTIPALSPTFRCIAPDLPGHGQSNVHPFNYRMHDYATILSDFLSLLKIRTFSLIGHSMGGQIGIILALRLAAVMEKMVLVAPAGFEQFTAHERQLLELSASYGHTLNVGGAGSSDNNAQRKSVSGMLAEPVFDFLPQIHTDSLVIFGEQDPFIPNRYLHHTTPAAIARSGTAQLPNAQLQLFNRCGHYPQTEQAERFNRALNNFLI
ncbi:alpha/beta fold hydrolase [Adhaeribacter soli]|uniref:Alpha/beta fold hydrolase n=1 Tax=Adhaeribacter soli TaxID=2607655 RepID=A0A5N1J4U6_9BACT|nr:alpha/beta fold hydrolase [Adhaeribacter soli]KAA9345747.1 alpha/beta fold hydrolase [Adhaeribacter soli]